MANKYAISAGDRLSREEMEERLRSSSSLIFAENMIKNDPVEKTKKYKEISEELEKRIIAEIGEGGYLGYCHRYWAVKKYLLKNLYDISWNSPAELNPSVCFD